MLRTRGAEAEIKTKTAGGGGRGAPPLPFLSSASRYSRGLRNHRPSSPFPGGGGDAVAAVGGAMVVAVVVDAELEGAVDERGSARVSVSDMGGKRGWRAGNC